MEGSIMTKYEVLQWDHPMYYSRIIAVVIKSRRLILVGNEYSDWV